MSILVSCRCGKKFKTGDQFAGKRAKCPGCGEPLTIPGGTAAPPPPPQMSKAVGVARAPAARPAVAATAQAPSVRPAAAPPAKMARPARAPVAAAEPVDDLLSLAEPEEVFHPASRADVPPTASSKPKKAGKNNSLAANVPPLSKRNRNTGPVNTPKITLSPGIIVMIVLAILIPSTITWVKLGPMKAAEQWREISIKAEDNVPGQILNAVLQYEKDRGGDVMDVKFLPKVTNFQFDESKAIMMLRLPDSMPFQGRTTEGNFYGTFHPKTWRFEARVEIHDAVHLVNGSANENDRSLEFDGKVIQK